MSLLSVKTGGGDMVNNLMSGAKASFKSPFISKLKRTAKRIHKFKMSEEDLAIVRETLPLVAKAGPAFTTHFYGKLFEIHPNLKNLFNHANQKRGSQPGKLFSTVALAATCALETGELPYEAIEGICQKHCALNIGGNQGLYDVVGGLILNTIEDLLTKDEKVLGAWGALYGCIVEAFLTREKEILDEMEATKGGWTGRREFSIAKKEMVCGTTARLEFSPSDGKPVPKWTQSQGKYTTVWCKLPEDSELCKNEGITEQPRHYTLAAPSKENDGKTLTISVQALGVGATKEGEPLPQGLCSNILHTLEVGDKIELSAPYGSFGLDGSEHLFLQNKNAPVVFLSAGIGITPMLALVESTPKNRLGKITWLHGCRSGFSHAYQDKVKSVPSVRSGLLKRRVWYTEPREEDGEPAGHSDNTATFHFKGRMNLTPNPEDTELKALLHVNNAETLYFLCGPPGWTKDIREQLLQLGVKETQLKGENFF